MREVAQQLEKWSDRPGPWGLATLVAVEGSSPREVGASLIFDPQTGAFHGSVSSGCVENVLLEQLPGIVAEDGVEHLEFGPAEVVPWAVGLTCGGTIRVRLERYFRHSGDPVMREIAAIWQQFWAQDEPGTLLSKGNRHCLMMSDGSILGERTEWPTAALGRALELCRGGLPSELWTPSLGDTAPIFLRVNVPRPRLVLFGAVHISVEIARLAAGLDCRVIVIDPRAEYLRAERFPVAPQETILGWPGEILPTLKLGPRDGVVALAHDSKIDDAGLVEAVRGGVGYLGALGSRQSQQARRERLQGLGLSDEECARIAGPVAAGLRSREAGEIALGILQEYIVWRRSLDASQ
jgi:xanthine dehydrogenase accessory factor